jgi:thioredoxin reductase/ferredoxin
MAVTWIVPLTLGGLAVAVMALFTVIGARRHRLGHAQPSPMPGVSILVHDINDDRCTGCDACVAVCPTNVLDLVDNKSRVLRFHDCIQCEACMWACPTEALVMFREGSEPPPLKVPELDDTYQTAIAGQYLIGEVAGKPLVKNAANLGRAVVEHIARDLAGADRRDAAVLDVVIVGSGPAGLSAGLTCKKLGLTCTLLEKEHVISSTVSRYPKGKHFMAEPSTDPNLSYLPVFDASKEDLVAAWKVVVDATALPVRLGEAVEGIKRGDDGVFEVKTTVSRYRARTVVLATGLRGKPRLLTVEGANLEKVQSRLEDPDEMAGQDVLVVGGGDSAIESAMSLATAGARVTLSYRGDSFKRAKPANQAALRKMVDAGALATLLGSNVARFTADEVSIKLADGNVTTLPNQQAFVLIGADTPVTWLENLGVRFVERPHLYALGSTEDAVRRVVPDADRCPRDLDEAIARVLGQPERKPTRLRSVVGEVVHEVGEALHDVAHEVSVVMRLPVRDATGQWRRIDAWDDQQTSVTRVTRVTAIARSPRAATGRVRALTPAPVRAAPMRMPVARPATPLPLPAEAEDFVDEPTWVDWMRGVV